jgi:hypothetical protein
MATMIGDFAGEPMVNPLSPEFKRLAEVFKRGEYPGDMTRAQLRTFGCAADLLIRAYTELPFQEPDDTIAKLD